MRKALIGLLITATAVTPLASAAAQSRDGRDRPRVERAERQLQRAERQERRADRAERRTDRRVERAVRYGNDHQVERAVRQERRADRVERRTDARVDRAERRLDRVERQAPSRTWSRNGDWDDRYRNRGGTTQHWDNDRDRDRRWDRDRRRDYSWNRNWRHDRRYDWRNYRNSHRHLYRAGRYYSPYRHHRYSRFSIGFFLEPLFFSSRYWLHDPWYYRLPPAYPGTRWIRYYDDVLLVDMYTGEVIDVIYDFFW